MTRLEIAIRKLNRLEKELEDNRNIKLDDIPFGQPNIIGRRDIYAHNNRVSARGIKLFQEIQKQKEYIETLEDKQKELPKIDRLKLEILEIEKSNSKLGLTKKKRELEKLENEVINAKTGVESLCKEHKKLVNDGMVNQWAKHPIYFFVKGMRKVALEIEDGKFIISKKYPLSETETEKVKKLLK